MQCPLRSTLKYETGFIANLPTENHRCQDSDSVYSTQITVHRYQQNISHAAVTDNDILIIFILTSTMSSLAKYIIHHFLKEIIELCNSSITWRNIEKCRLNWNEYTNLRTISETHVYIRRLREDLGKVDQRACLVQVFLEVRSCQCVTVSCRCMSTGAKRYVKMIAVWHWCLTHHTTGTWYYWQWHHNCYRSSMSFFSFSPTWTHFCAFKSFTPRLQCSQALPPVSSTLYTIYT